jgi:DNA-binding CsgD family transcriptional regulator
MDVLVNRLVGRDAELNEARLLLGDAREHSVARVLRIAGVSGIGKTAVALAVADQAQRDGWVTAIAVSHRIQATLPFVVARKMIAGLIDALGADAATYTSGLEGEISIATSSGASSSHAIEDVLFRLAEAVLLDRPLVLLVDDAQWADPESRTLFARLLEALADRPFVLLTTERSDEREDHALGLVDAAIALGELSLDATMELTRSLLPMISDDVVRAISEHARGRAIDVVAFARTAENPSSMTPAEVAATIRARIAKEVKLLDAGTREFLQICALISDPINYELLKQLWPDEEQLLQHIQACSTRFLIQDGDALHFVHAAIAQSIRETVAIEIPFRRRIVQAIKQLPTRRLEDYERLVEQAAASGDKSEEKTFLVTLMDEAEKVHALPVVARALERIIALTPFSQEKSLALYSRLSMVYNALGRDNETHRVCSEALRFALGNGVREGIGQLVVSELFALLFRGDRDEAVRVMERFDQYLASPRDRAQLLAAKLWSALCDSDDANFERARQDFKGLNVADPLFDIRLASFDAIRLASHGDNEGAQSSLESARSQAHQVPLMSIMVDATEVLVSLQSFGPGHPRTISALERAPTSHDTVAYASLLSALARGNAPDVLQQAAEALIHHDGSHARRLFIGVAGTAASLTGIDLPASLRNTIDNEAAVLLHGHGSGWLLPIAAASSALGSRTDAPQSLSLLSTIVDKLVERPIEPVIVFIPYVLVVAAKALQDRKTLERIARGELLDHRFAFSVAQGKLAQLGAKSALGDVPALNEVLRLRDDFMVLGSPFFAELASHLQPKEAPAVRTAENKLTRRELEVSSLIADGLTNREIAERLVLSERTVEAHIANIFGKIDASSRSQVAIWYARSVATIAAP